MTYTCASLFSGGGGFDIGAKAAGFIPVCASEYDPAIAAVYAENLGNHIRVGDILEENPATWPSVDLLHASPPCPNFSTAKTNASETPHDIALATKVYDAPILNAADFGVPQTRQRLFLRAVRGGMVPPLPPPTRWIGWYEAIADIIDTLPETEFAEWQLKRMGEAMKKMQRMTDDVFIGGVNKSESFLQFAVENRPTIPGIRNSDEPMSTVPADLPTLNAGRAILFSNQTGTDGEAGRKTELNNRLSEKPSFTVAAHHRTVDGYRAFLMESKNANQQYGDGVRLESEPATTVITDHKFSHQPTAFIVDQVNGGRDSTVRESDEPMFTTSIYSTKHPQPRAWLSQGRVVKMTPRALARFQSFPDSYTLPAKASLACRIIGNAVPPLLAEAVCRSLLR